MLKYFLINLLTMNVRTFLFKSYYGWILHKINRSSYKLILIYPCSLLNVFSLFSFEICLGGLLNLAWRYFCLFFIPIRQQQTTRHIKVKKRSQLWEIFGICWEKAQTKPYFPSKYSRFNGQKEKRFALSDHY